MKNNQQKNKILIIDRCVDVVGGVERVICTIANNLVDEYDIEILNEEKLVNKSFFHYNSQIKKNYLYNRTSGLLHNSTQNSFLSCLNEFRIKLTIKLTRRYKIHSFLKAHANIKAIIFGRTTIALHFLPLIKKLNISTNVIVRDAIHIAYLSQHKRKKMLKFFPGTVDTFIISSDESKKEYEKLFEKNSLHIVKIYNPLAIKPKQVWNFDNKTITAIGRLDDTQKGFDALLPAFKLIEQKHPDWRLIIYGKGRAEKDLHNIIQRYNLKNVEIKDFTSDIIKTFGQTSIFIFPSHYEGYANTLVEALACGIPSVTFNWLMGAEEIIENNKTGIIVPLQNRLAYYNGEVSQKDINNLAEATFNLIEHRELAEQISNNAKNVINDRSKDIILKEWKKLIEN